MDRIVYDFDSAVSGGWSKLNRYDFRIRWEYLGALGAVAAILAGLLALIVARTLIKMKSARPAFAVLGSGHEIEQSGDRSA